MQSEYNKIKLMSIGCAIVDGVGTLNPKDIHLLIPILDIGPAQQTMAFYIQVKALEPVRVKFKLNIGFATGTGINLTTQVSQIFWGSIPIESIDDISILQAIPITSGLHFLDYEKEVVLKANEMYAVVITWITNLGEQGIALFNSVAMNEFDV